MNAVAARPWGRPLIGITLAAAVLAALFPFVEAPSARTLRTLVADVGVPSGWELDSQSEDGDILCFDVCTVVLQRYALPEDADVVAELDAYEELLVAGGFTPEAADGDDRRRSYVLGERTVQVAGPEDVGTADPHVDLRVE